jgi:hypothetical protein
MGWWSKVPNDLAIYLNRTIRPVENVGTVATLDAPQVIVVYVPDGAQTPRVFEGAELIGQTRRNKGEWRAYSLRR